MTGFNHETVVIPSITSNVHTIIIIVMKDF